MKPWGATVLAVVVALCGFNGPARADLPADALRFQDYQVPVYTGKPVRPELRSHRRSYLFRTELREAAAEGPNFAGYY